MSREVRKVPADWQHPKYENGNYVGLLDQSYEAAVKEWENESLPEWIGGARLWANGLVKNYSGGTKTIQQAVDDTEEHNRPRHRPTYEWWAGDVPPKPVPEDYMPTWPADQLTHFQMYETVSEGTPISPVMATEEGLAKWLADNGASACGSMTATYDQWLAMIREGSSHASMVIHNGEMVSGVAAVSEL